MPFPSRGLSARQLLTHTKLRACQLRHCRGLLSPVGALKIRSCSPDEARKALNCSIGAPRVTPSPNIYYFSCSVTYLSHTHTCLFFTLVSNRQKATQNIVKENILFSTFYRGAQIASTKRCIAKRRLLLHGNSNILYQVYHSRMTKKKENRVFS